MISLKAMCRATLGLLGVLVAVSCATTTPSGTDSNTHWLDQCRTDEDCGSLVCQCGACTKPCSATSDCKSLGAAASCGAASCVTDTKVCIETCATTADCPKDARALSCESGQCVPKRPDGDGGTHASGVCPDDVGPGVVCSTNTSCMTACADGWQSPWSCTGGHWVGGLGLIPCGPDGGVTDSGTPSTDAPCPPGAKGGDACGVAQAECWTPCTAGAGGDFRGKLDCSGGQWVAAQGLYGCIATPTPAVDSGTNGCAAMDASPNPSAPCGGPSRYKWDGANCVSVGCACSGADCSATWASEAECRTARAACLGATAFSNSCTSGADCQLVGTACCRPCAEPRIPDTVPLNVSSISAWSQSLQCGGVSCPPCMGPPGTIQAMCQAGTCTSVNLAPFAPCLEDADCVLRAKDCCECGDLSSLNALVAINGSMRDQYAQAFCNPAADCGACTPQYPISIFTRCEPSGGYCYATWAIP